MAWYVRKEATQGDDMKREFPSTPSEAFEQSVDGAYFSRQMAAMDRQDRITVVPYQEGYPVFTYWDLGHTAIIFVQHLGTRHHIIDYEEVSNGGMPEAIRIVRGKDYIYGDFCAPHDIKHTEWGSGKTRIELAQEMGIDFWRVPSIPVQDGINAAQNIMSQCWIDKENCSQLLKCLRSYRREWDDKLVTFRKEPLKNWASHGADAFRYFAVTYQTTFEIGGEDRFSTQFIPPPAGKRRIEYPEYGQEEQYTQSEGYKLL